MIAVAAILNFHKWHFGPVDTYNVHIYQPSKFGANWSRIGQDTPFCVFSKMAPYWISKTAILEPWWHLCCPYLLATKFGANWSRFSRDTPFCVFFQMAAAAILNFLQLVFWTAINTYIDHIYRHTKFGANCPRIGRYTPFCVFSKIAAAAILDLLFIHFGPPTMSHLLGSMLPANGVMISLNLSEILWFYHFAILAGKYLFPPMLGFGGFWPRKLRRHHFNPKIMKFP